MSQVFLGLAAAEVHECAPGGFSCRKLEWILATICGVCTTSVHKPVQSGPMTDAAWAAMVHFTRCAHAEDLRSGCRPERQPEHAPCLGAPLRLPQAAAVAGPAPA